MPPKLGRVVRAWDQLPPHVQETIRLLVDFANHAIANAHEDATKVGMVNFTKWATVTNPIGRSTNLHGGSPSVFVQATRSRISLPAKLES